jgi:phosphate transport system substrate-binding protein
MIETSSAMLRKLIMLMAVLLATPLQALAAPGGPTGAIVIAGNGPELLMMERLARSFEKEHPGTAVDIEWESTSDPIAMLQSGAASYAVTGERIAGLAAIPIAWDGIAVVVYAAHSIRDLTSGQLAAMFTSETSSWPDGNGHETTIRILNRPLYQNIRQRFEEALNIVGRIPPERRSFAPIKKR